MNLYFGIRKINVIQHRVDELYMIVLAIDVEPSENLMEVCKNLELKVESN